ncbi:MAG: lytic transglycosylase domain-containing protein [Bacteroidetes bacterium]|nr:lytic transglycosylase domain-containing protein [Bacteroidota bacterium]
MKKYWVFIFLLVMTSALLKFLIASTGSPDDEYSKLFRENQHTYALNLPKELFFADEKVPLNIFDVRERLDRELLVNVYWQSQTILLIKRANRWFPVIEPILKKNNVPDDFKYLCVAESGLNNVVSPSNAVGFWQFIESTGKLNGLEMNDEVDERYSVERSTEAACDFFNKAYSQFGSWTLVAASYNMGTTGLEKQIEKQKAHNYYDLLLNDETFRYVFRILAIKEIMNHAVQYGFYFRYQDLYPPFEYNTVTVDSGIADLADFSIQNKINYKTLKMLNPWLRQNYLINKNRKSYSIKILKTGFGSVSDSLK